MEIVKQCLLRTPLHLAQCTAPLMRCGAKPERAARDARPSWAAERAPSQTRVPALATGLCRPGSAERGALCEAACRTFLSSCPWPGMLETPVPLPSLPPDLMKAVQTEKAFSVPSAASASSDMVASACVLGRRRSSSPRASPKNARVRKMRAPLPINCGQVKRPEELDLSALLQPSDLQVAPENVRGQQFLIAFSRGAGGERREPPPRADRPWAMPSS